MKSRMGKGLIAASMISVMGGVGLPATVLNGGALAVSDNTVSAKSTTGTKAAVNKSVKAHRLTSTLQSGYRWLKVTNKEKFKQSRRKQIARRSFKKSKKNGRT